MAVSLKIVFANQVRRPGGFTLVEMLVVIAIIGLIAALLLPSLSAAKASALTAGCVSNLRQLNLGWKLYSDENSGRLPVNIPLPGNQPAWIAGDFTEPGNLTNQTLIRQGLVFPFVRSPAIYRCPADTAMTNRAPVILSYSMNGWMGSRTMNDDQAYAAVTYNLSYRTFVRESEISVIGAASRLWVLSDEDHSTLNDGWFLVTMDDTKPFGSFPGIRHRHGGGVIFADGHAEIIKLRDPGSYPGRQINLLNSDWLLLKQRTTEP
jgi:prepilin-type N-terminal cleavage/methylation domain-containing protein/prepilin-type processing-associated H-X9-DG protein